MKLAQAPRAPRGFWTTTKGVHVPHSPCQGDLAESTAAAPQSKRDSRFPPSRICPPLPTEPIHPDPNHGKNQETCSAHPQRREIDFIQAASRGVARHVDFFAGEMDQNHPEGSALEMPPWSISLASSCGCRAKGPRAQPPRPHGIHSAGSRSSARLSAGSASPTCVDLQVGSRDACGLRAPIS